MELIRMRVGARRALTPQITEFTLVPMEEGALPGFTPGAHVTVETPSGAMRRYSLVNDGTAVAFGNNAYGTCDVPAQPHGRRYIGAAAGAFHTVLLRDDGEVVAFGRNNDGQCDENSSANLPPRGHWNFP